MKSDISLNEKQRTSSVLLHDFRLVLKQNAVMFLLGFVIFCVLFPVSTCAVPDTSVFNVDYTHQQLKFRFCADEVVPLIQAAAVLFGGACGMRLFGFLTDRNRTSFYMSLGLKRRKLCVNRLAAGLLVTAACIVIPVFLSGVINYCALGMNDGLVSYGVYLAAGLTAQSYAGLLAAAAACCIAGTFSEAAALCVTIAAAPSAVIYFINSLLKTFLWGNVFGETTYAMETVEPGLLEKLSPVNPLIFFYSEFRTHYFFSREMASADPESIDIVPLLIQWAVILAAGAAVCLLFLRRKSENAGISGLSRFCSLAVSFVWPLGVFAAVLDALGETGRFLAAAAAYFCSLLTFGVLSAVSAKNVSAGRKLGRWGCLTCIVAAGILLMDTGLLGTETRIPETEDIRSVSVSYVGQPSLMPVQVQASSSGPSYYFSGQVTLSDEESVECVREMHSSLAQGGIREFGASGEDFSETVIPYDIRVEYTLKSGKTVKRYYDRASLGELSEFLNLEECEEFRSASSAAVRGELASSFWNSEAFASGEIYLADSALGNLRKISLADDSRKALLEAVASDLSSQSVNSRYFPEKDAEARLFFTLNGESDLETFEYSTSNASVWITDEFTETKALLKEWGALNEESGETGKIESITLQKFDPYGSMNKITDPVSVLFQSYRSDSDDEFPFRQDFGSRPEITDPEQISQIAWALRSTYFMSDGGCIAAVKLEGSSEYVYKFLPYESAPEFIRQKMK